METGRIRVAFFCALAFLAATAGRSEERHPTQTRLLKDVCDANFKLKEEDAIKNCFGNLSLKMKTIVRAVDPAMLSEYRHKVDEARRMTESAKSDAEAIKANDLERSAIEFETRWIQRPMEKMVSAGPGNDSRSRVWVNGGEVHVEESFFVIGHDCGGHRELLWHDGSDAPLFIVEGDGLSRGSLDEWVKKQLPKECAGPKETVESRETAKNDQVTKAQNPVTAEVDSGTLCVRSGAYYQDTCWTDHPIPIPQRADYLDERDGSSHQPR